MTNKLSPKYFLHILVFVFCFPVSTAMALPEVTVTAGVKLWQNEWTYRASSNVKFEDSSFLIGPSIKLSMQRYFAGITYMRSSDDYDLTWRNYSMKTPRTDTDMVAGYLFGSHLALFAGYKGIRYATDNYQSGEWLSNGSNAIDAGLVGVSLYRTFKTNGLTLMASLAGGIYQANSRYEFQDDTESEDDLLRFGNQGQIYSVQAGLTLPISEMTFLNISYKYQLLQSDVDTDMDFRGILYSLDFVF